jgi:hypothetical protein
MFLGRLYTDTYARHGGLGEEKFLERFGGTLTADQAGRTISDLAADDSYTAAAFVISLAGLKPLEYGWTGATGPPGIKPVVENWQPGGGHVGRH